MILITGATGGLGMSIIKAYLNKMPNERIAGLVRIKSRASELEAENVELRVGDYDDFNSLQIAFQGIRKLVLVSAPALSDQRYAQESNVILAAKEAGVQHIIFTGIQNRKDRRYEIPYITKVSEDVEQLLMDSGIAYTIVENTIYADSIPIFTGDVSVKNQFLFPAGEGRIAYATRADLGEGIAELLLQEGHENKKYTFSNSSSWSFHDIASILSNAYGGDIQYIDVSKSDYVYHKVQEGLPDFVAEFLANWGSATSAGEFSETNVFLESLLGRKPTPLEEFLPQLYARS